MLEEGEWEGLRKQPEPQQPAKERKGKKKSNTKKPKTKQIQIKTGKAEKKIHRKQSEQKPQKNNQISKNTHAIS